MSNDYGYDVCSDLNWSAEDMPPCYPDYTNSAERDTTLEYPIVPYSLLMTLFDDSSHYLLLGFEPFGSIFATSGFQIQVSV